MDRTYSDVRYVVADGVATITIDRPDVLNALRLVTIAELTDAFERADADERVGVIVLTGAGERAFCVGGDQKELVSRLDADGWRDLAVKLKRLLATMRYATKPVIAAVRGWCIGGGHELHCFADLTIADETARFGQVGAKVGGAPIFVTRLLPRIVGEKRAREILYVCDQYTAAQALELGLVNRVVPAGQLETAVNELATTLLSRSPTVIRVLKHGISAEPVLDDEAIDEMVELLAPFFGSLEHVEATSAFRERREPDFSRFRGGL